MSRTASTSEPQKESDKNMLEMDDESNDKTILTFDLKYNLT